MVHLVHVALFLKGHKSGSKKLLSSIVVCFPEVHYFVRIVVLDQRA